MDERIEKITRFLSVCDELVYGKYILADTKIGELLKIIATSRELTDLFSAVTEQFDFIEAKKSYLRFPAHKGAAHGAAFLPFERGDLLAFVFCLLVEFDSGAVRLNDFLLRYFYEDGSYTASYAIFADRMMRPFRDIISGCFPQVSNKSFAFEKKRQKEGEILQVLSTRLTVERARLNSLIKSAEDLKNGELIVCELLAAIGREDLNEIRALSCGYRYFLKSLNFLDESREEIFALIKQI